MTDPTPRQQWEALKAEFLERVREIDNATPWSMVEPLWWAEMVDAANKVRGSD